VELFLLELFLPELFRPELFLAELFLGLFLEAVFFAGDFRAALFLAALFLVPLLLAELFFFAEADRDGGGGTLAPDLRASDKPMAMACFGFFTLRPLPDFSLPFLKAFISRSTDDCALGPYFLPEAFLAAISAPCALHAVGNPVTW
jgi:hypothetical protein